MSLKTSHSLNDISTDTGAAPTLGGRVIVNDNTYIQVSDATELVAALTAGEKYIFLKNGNYTLTSPLTDYDLTDITLYGERLPDEVNNPGPTGVRIARNGPIFDHSDSGNLDSLLTITPISRGDTKLEVLSGWSSGNLPAGTILRIDNFAYVIAKTMVGATGSADIYIRDSFVDDHGTISSLRYMTPSESFQNMMFENIQFEDISGGFSNALTFCQNVKFRHCSVSSDSGWTQANNLSFYNCVDLEFIEFTKDYSSYVELWYCNTITFDRFGSHNDENQANEAPLTLSTCANFSITNTRGYHVPDLNGCFNFELDNIHMGNTADFDVTSCQYFSITNCSIENGYNLWSSHHFTISGCSTSANPPVSLTNATDYQIFGNRWQGSTEHKYITTTAPDANHDGVDSNAIGTSFVIGDRWYNGTTKITYTCSDNTTGAAVWDANVASVNTFTGNVLLTADDIPTGTSYRIPTISQIESLDTAITVVSNVSELEAALTALRPSIYLKYTGSTYVLNNKIIPYNGLTISCEEGVIVENPNDEPCIEYIDTPTEIGDLNADPLKGDTSLDCGEIYSALTAQIVLIKLEVGTGTHTVYELAKDATPGDSEVHITPAIPRNGARAGADTVYAYITPLIDFKMKGGTYVSKVGGSPRVESVLLTGCINLKVSNINVSESTLHISDSVGVFAQKLEGSYLNTNTMIRFDDITNYNVRGIYGHTSQASNQTLFQGTRCSFGSMCDIFGAMTLSGFNYNVTNIKCPHNNSNPLSISGHYFSVRDAHLGGRDTRFICNNSSTFTIENVFVGYDKITNAAFDLDDCNNFSLVNCTAPLTTNWFSAANSFVYRLNNNRWSVRTVTANTTAYPCDELMCDTNSVGAFTVTLPTAPPPGTKVILYDAAGTWATNNLTVAPASGENLRGVTDDTLIIDISHFVAEFKYLNVTVGWTWRLDG